MMDVALMKATLKVVFRSARVWVHPRSKGTLKNLPPEYYVPFQKLGIKCIDKLKDTSI